MRLFVPLSWALWLPNSPCVINKYFSENTTSKITTTKNQSLEFDISMLLSYSIFVFRIKLKTFILNISLFSSLCYFRWMFFTKLVTKHSGITFFTKQTWCCLECLQNKLPLKAKYFFWGVWKCCLWFGIASLCLFHKWFIGGWSKIHWPHLRYYKQQMLHYERSGGCWTFLVFVGWAMEDADPELISGAFKGARFVSCSNDQYSFNSNIECHVASWNKLTRKLNNTRTRQNFAIY